MWRLVWGLTVCATVVVSQNAFDTNPRPTTVGGRPVDPCVADLWGGNTLQDCEASPHLKAQSVPDAGVLLMLASDRSLTKPNSVEWVVQGTGTFTNPGGVNSFGYCLAAVDAQGRSLCANGCDGTIVNENVNTGTVAVPLGPAATQWNNGRREFEVGPRSLCRSTTANGAGPFRYVGVKVGVAWDCSSTNPCSNWLTTANVNAYQTLTGTTFSDRQLSQLQARTSCCDGSAGGSGVGVCYNPNAQGCCGNVPFDRSFDKCCVSSASSVQYQNKGCNCNAVADCPTGQGCCKPTKFASLSTLNNAALGTCYNAATQRCCDTGAVYDPGQQQCCSITGLQSLDNACPCSTDAQCAGGQPAAQANTNMRCCQQWAPTIFRGAADATVNPTANEVVQCNKYNNFPAVDRRPILRQDGPFGQGDPDFTRCSGVCIDTSYQICCNGAACIKEYEKCCNSTCCNKFVGTCVEGLRPGTPGNAANWQGFAAKYYQCSTFEQLSILKSFWVFVLPTFLLAATLLSLAIVLVFANKTTAIAYHGVERALMILAVLSIIFAMPTYFSPVYKYGVVTVVVMLLVFLTAAIRVRWVNIVTIFALLVLILYLFDPFHGNSFLTFASNRILPDETGPNNQAQQGEPDSETAGILHATGKMYRTTAAANALANGVPTGYCVKYFNYFFLDPNLLDTDRFDNPEVTTFGYCSRGWVTTLLVFEAILMILVLVLFVLAIIALAIRFQKDAPVDLVLEEEGPMPMSVPFY